MGQKAIIRFWWESGLSSACKNHLTTFLQTFHSLHMFKILFRDGSLYSKQLSSFVCCVWSTQTSPKRWFGKHKYDVKLWRHKQRTPNTNEAIRHWINPPPWKFSAYATGGGQPSAH